MIFFLSVMDIILKKNLFILKIIKQNVQLVKEELRRKKRGDKCTPKGRF